MEKERRGDPGAPAAVYMVTIDGEGEKVKNNFEIF